MNLKLSEQDRQRVAEFIEQEVGIQLPAAKHSLVETRLRKRQRANSFSSLNDYINYVLNTQEGENEKLHMIDALTTNKTDFYREPSHFTFLNEMVEKHQRLHAFNASRPLKIWSAGCSTGEEPYTLAIELTEIQRKLSNFDFHITATDVSISSLKKAKRGVYTEEKIEPISMALRKRYLLKSRNKDANLVKLSPELRQKIEFSFFNFLINDFAEFANNFDFIFCRNVMIYFNNGDRTTILQKFSHCLKKEGILCIGHSESLPPGLNTYQRLRPTIYQLAR